MGAKGEDGDRLGVIGATRSWQTALYAAGVAVLLALAVRAFVRDDAPNLVGIGYLAAVVALLVAAWRRRRATITLDDDGLHVDDRGRRRSFAWEELLEVGWVARGSWSGVVVRPTGGPYDVPGPSSPEQVLRLPSHGRGSHVRARATLAAHCARHGVPFTADGVRLEMDAPPGSPYRRAT